MFVSLDFWFIPSSITQQWLWWGRVSYLTWLGFLAVHPPGGNLVVLPSLPCPVSMQSAGHTEREQSTVAFGESALLTFAVHIFKLLHLWTKASELGIMVFYNIIKSEFNLDMFAAMAELLKHHLCFFSWRNLFSCRFWFLAWILCANVRVMLYIKMYHYSFWYHSVINMK